MSPMHQFSHSYFYPDNTLSSSTYPTVTITSPTGCLTVISHLMCSNRNPDCPYNPTYPLVFLTSINSTTFIQLLSKPRNNLGLSFFFPISHPSPVSQDSTIPNSSTSTTSILVNTIFQSCHSLLSMVFLTFMST